MGLGETVHGVGDRLGAGPIRDFNRFMKEVKAEMPALAERDETAEPVVKKVHGRGAAASPIQGLFEFGDGRRRRVAEYEPDTELRDTEQIPLQEEGGIEGFLGREVLPYAPHAWYVPESVKIGYEVSFNRYFYKPEPMRTLEEIRADILAVERETAGLLHEIIEHMR